MTRASQSSERSPLLQHNTKDDGTTIAHEARVLLQYTVPLVALNMLRMLVQTTSIFCLGQLGTRELASANLGILTVNVIGYSIQIGLISSLDTLANQAIRSTSPKLTSIYAMRAFVVCLIVMPPMYLVLWNSQTILSAIIPRADPEMIHLAALYVKLSSLGILPMAAFECLRRYLQSMGLMRGPTTAYIIAAPVSIALTYVFTFKWLGFAGAPLAVATSYLLLFIYLAIYTYFAAPRYAWAGLSMAIFEDLGLNFRYGLAGIASVCSEWYAFECVSLGASYLGETSQAATAILLTLASICWQVPLSLSQGVSIRIGNLMGEKRPVTARRSSDTAQLFAFVVTGGTAVLLQIFRRSLASLFSQDPEVIAKVDRTAWLLAIVALFDGLQGSCTGILKGAGLPMVASRINLFSYWIIGLPFGALITFKMRRVEGLFAGLALAVAFAASLMLFRIWRCDWSKQAEEAQDRIATSDAIAGLSNIEVVPEDTEYP